MLRRTCGRLPLLLAERTLIAGESGESDLDGRSARKGLFAASGLIGGKAVLDGLGSVDGLLLVKGGDRTRFCGSGWVDNGEDARAI